MSFAWKTLCCPVDFTEESRAALRVATDLCRRFGSALTLLFVENPNAPMLEQGGPAEKLSAWRHDAEAQGVREVRTERAQGDPELAIADHVNGMDVDLVVMGTHARTGRDRSLVGSVAESTVRRARCPVLVVHSDWPALASA